MSEFDKLMKGGSQRKEVKQRQGDRRQIRVMLLWSFCIAIILSLIPPHLGIFLFIPILVIAFLYSLREWIC